MSEDRCPQCQDNKWFERIGVKKHLKQIHEEAVKEANEQAKIWATSDYMNNCSLGWNTLWVVHFSKTYESLVSEKRKRVISDYQTACYKKPYGAKERDICCYHAECRYS